ncbi:MAG: 5'/3'-nucleotidase SurE [Bacilli bacterium]|nr:5'/3'-nucleotidase SurE [Bacilli bacterium]
MKILITNDDGINSINLKLLVKCVLKYYKDIIVVAPFEEQSAVSHKINIATPIKLRKHEDIYEGIPTYSITSTPADCVKFAKLTLKYDFDLVFSGINNGLNLGEDIVYSGTVAAATEACLLGKRSIACSVERNDNIGFEEGFDIFMKEYLNNPKYNMCKCYNVNFPREPKGIKFAYQGCNDYKYWFEDLGNNMYLPKALKGFESNGLLETDLDCYHNGYVTVTPITEDMTDYKVLNSFKHK